MSAQPYEPIEVIAFVASHGGGEALQAILGALPVDLDAAIVVQAHPVEAGTSGEVVTPVIADAARDGDRLDPGRILACPPGHGLEVLPDRTCRLRTGDERPLDLLLTSLADSVGPRALAVLLTAPVDDGAAGVHALTLAGGTVIVDPDDTGGAAGLARTVTGMVTGAAGNEPDAVEHLTPELRTPLTLLVGSLEGALRRDDLPADLRDELAASARRARRLQRLMDTLLDLSAREHERLSQVAATDAFRLALTDSLRVLDDPAEIQAVACEMLARHLGVSRTYYTGAEEGGLVRVHRDVHHHLPSLAGVYRITDFGDDLVDGLFSNKTLVADDLDELDLDEHVRAAWRAVSIAALITVPHVRDGRWLGTLTVAHHEPRKWTPAEVALVEETAQRTWRSLD